MNEKQATCGEKVPDTTGGTTSFGVNVWLQRSDDPTRSKRITVWENADSRDQVIEKIRSGYSDEEKKRILEIRIVREVANFQEVDPRRVL